jgi:hydrogenase-1 operon protein HyaF
MMTENPASLTATRTGMARSLLHEIARHLSKLEGCGEASAIDLRSLPMTQADREELEELLGCGDVDITLKAAGKSEIWETRFSGVWWVRHFSGDDRIAAETIEITSIPEILIAHRSDISAASKRLEREISALQEMRSQEEVRHG